MESTAVQSSCSLYPYKDLPEDMFELRGKLDNLNKVTVQCQDEESEESEIASLKETIKLLENDKVAAQGRISRMVSDHKAEVKKLSEEKRMIQREADLLKTTNAELETRLAKKYQVVEEISFLEDLCLHLEKKRRGISGKKMGDRDIELKKLRSKMPVDKTSVFSNTSPKVADLQGTNKLNINKATEENTFSDDKRGMELSDEQNQLMTTNNQLMTTNNLDFQDNVKQLYILVAECRNPNEVRDNTIWDIPKEQDSLKEDLIKTRHFNH